MIEINKVVKSFHHKEVLNIEQLTIHKGETVAVTAGTAQKICRPAYPCHDYYPSICFAFSDGFRGVFFLFCHAAGRYWLFAGNFLHRYR